MSSASEMFQSVIERVLAGISGAKVFIDDILIFGANQDEHDRALAAVLGRLEEHGITINKKKCQFSRSEVTFMGHRLSSDGICPTAEKVDTIRRLRNPETAEELRSFLGLINYLGKFIPHLSTHTAPLRELLHREVKFKWTTQHTEAFEKLKAEVADPKNLGYYSPYDETIVIADASPVGLGAVLLQVKDGVKRAICYISKGLSPAEKSYAQNEREALALVWAVERLEQYLRGLFFQLVTDHEPLKVLFGENKKCPRIERWAVRLQSFRYKIVHIPGKVNIADPLSRLPRFRECTTYDQVGEAMLLAVLDSVKPTALTLQEIQEKTLADVELSAVKEALGTGRWNDSVKAYLPFRDELLVVGEVVLRAERIVIPIALRQRVLKLAHIGHPGIERTKQRLRGKVWWPNADKEAERAVKSCLDCQLVGGSSRPEPLSVREMPSQPWHTLAMDILGPLPSGESILVIIDLYSRYRITEALQKTTSEAIIEKLSRNFLRLGFPSTLLSDNAKNFTSHQVMEFGKRYGIDLKHTTPYWPQANGEVERQNRNILKTLKIADINGTDWKTDLEEANYVYSMIPHPATGRSPAELAFGRKLKDWIPQMTGNPNTERDDGPVRDHNWEYKQKAKVYYDAAHNARESDLQPQDRVLMRNLVPRNKLSATYLPEPATVVQKTGNSVVVQTESGKQYRRNSSHLKRLTGPGPSDVQQHDESTSTEWVTPPTLLASKTSTPMDDSSAGEQRRPQREIRRPLRFEDYEMDG